MAVPNYQDLMKPALQVLAEASPLHVRDVRTRVATLVGLTELDLHETYDNGKLRYPGRVGWALTYLKQAGALSSPGRGTYAITDRGRSLLNERLIDNSVLERFTEFTDFKSRSREHKAIDTAAAGSNTATPEERLESAYDELRAHVAAEVLERLRAMDPLRFERVVLEVLTAMGYGGSDPERTALTAISHDGGLDGVIREDELGLDQVVVQAKRFNSVVDVKYVREFAGSLDEHGTNKGVFFTTDRFTGPALSYVKSIPKRIVLIDGPELARLMVHHGVGVSVTKTLRLTRVDNDYFDIEGE